MKPITRGQSLAARHLLQWTATYVCKIAQIDRSTLQKWEKSENYKYFSVKNNLALRATYESSGVIVFDDEKGQVRRMLPARDEGLVIEDQPPA